MGTQGGGDKRPDLIQGVTLADFDDRQILCGYVGKKAVLLARVGDEVLATDATCTHYSGPLAEGLLIGDTVRCPLHHACFPCAPVKRLARRPSIPSPAGRLSVMVTGS